MEDDTRRGEPTKWHESAAAVFIILVLGAVLTSPCWVFALLLAVRK
jgi:hypothetical protein